MPVVVGVATTLVLVNGLGGVSVVDPAPSRAVIALLYSLMLGALFLALLVGLVRRAVASARRESIRAGLAAAASERSERIAVLQHQRAELSREVHDVVGHSLAVIVALADSVRFSGPDPEGGAAPGAASVADRGAALDEVRAVVSTIASTARSSLAEVREVLNRLDAAPSRPPSGADRGATASPAVPRAQSLTTSRNRAAAGTRLLRRRRGLVLEGLRPRPLKRGRCATRVCPRLESPAAAR
jgi:signal transduction histidine kinase